MGRSLAGAMFVMAVLTLGQTSTYSQDKGKEGWSIAPCPLFSYNSDLGIQMGAMSQFYFYGDGSSYPDYLHKIEVEGSHYTKGSNVFSVSYDTEALVPGTRLTASATYITSTMYPFMGFNGTSSPWVEEWDANKDLGTAFYNVDRMYIRVLADMQGRIHGNLNWVGGIAFRKYGLKDISVEGYDPQKTLYRAYQAAGLISPEDADGGSHLEFKGGLSFDSRDHISAPSKGISAEAYLYGSPDFFQDWRHSYLKLSAHFRHYVPIWKDRITLAYHLAYQGLVAGDAPFYTLQEISVLYLMQTVNDGLGSKNTVRGTLYNRFIGNGYAWTNIELRARLFELDLFGQHWGVATNPFFDAGKVVQPYMAKEQKETGTVTVAGSTVPVYSGESEKIHCSVGIGGKLSMNENFILSAELARTFRKEDGSYGLSLGMNYIF